MSIHTIGDSHSGFGWSGIIQHHLGPLLCYSFAREGLKRCDIRNFDIRDGDTIIFCLGEIDCRCHINKHVNESTRYQDIIDYVVYYYFEAIKLNISISHIIPKHVCVYNIVPPIQKHTIYEDPLFPHVGSDDERKQYVLYFNQKLKEHCLLNEYIFFDVYDNYADENGFLQTDMSDGSVHIRDGTHIENFIKKFIHN